MLPEFPPNIRFLPDLTFVRDLEAFEGPILSEYRASRGGRYLEKWCARDTAAGITRTLLVRTEQRPVAEYLAGRMSMIDLLMGPSDGVGFIVDRVADEMRAVYLVALSRLPQKYLPKPTAMHDPSLRPEWESIPQDFLLGERWNARLLADIERLYQDAAAFALATDPKTDVAIPYDVFAYVFDGGWVHTHAFRRLRGAVPDALRSTSAGVSANSPGVLSIDAPNRVAVRLAQAISALRRSEKAYDVVHSWSKLKPTKADHVPDDALSDLRRLADFIGVDLGKLLPSMRVGSSPDKVELLIGGKLVAAYYRKLWKLVEPGSDVEFISVDTSELRSVSPPQLVFEEDEEDEWP